MGKYNFDILSPFEFEELVRDLLQKHLNLFLESFGEGRDNGIDLRYAYDKNKSLIIQCKRIKDFSQLKYNLQNIELKKVKKLNPKRYIIVIELLHNCKCTVVGR